MRNVIAWILYYLGHFIYLVFDEWTHIGMIGPIYKIYNNLMIWSSNIQKDSNGPWEDTMLEKENK